MLKSVIVLSALHAVSAQTNIPATGDNGAIGGIFGGAALMQMPKATSPKNVPVSKNPGGFGGLLSLAAELLDGTPITAIAGLFGGAGAEAGSPKRLSPQDLNNTGTGQYPAVYMVDPSLPEKTIYAPRTPPPASVKMPVIVWGQGGCYKTGTFYQPFLLELASHGYLVLANGPPTDSPPNTVGDLMRLIKTPQTKVKDLLDSIDWVTAGKAAKYGNIDTSKIAAAGQSCGGVEALSASYHNDKIKLTILVNSGGLDPTKKFLMKEFKYPIGIFNGGPHDIAFMTGNSDYEAYPAGIGALNANLDTGHGGTLFSLNGGKFGKAISAFFEWNFRGDAKAKARFLDPDSPDAFVKDKWNISAKGW